MKDITVVGIDIAKNVFHVCEMNRGGKVHIRKRLSRSQVLDYVSRLPKCLVAMESCGGSSFWAREIEKLGFSVRLIPAQFVKPFVKSQKNDSIDAEAIAEAALRPTMRFVSPNTEEQQDIQNIHRVRDLAVKHRTALSNQIRGLLLEYGVAIPQGVNKLLETLSSLVDDSPHSERHIWKRTFSELQEELRKLSERIKEYDRQLQLIARSNPVCQNLQKIHGVGPLTATAIVAAVRSPNDFKNGRQFAAWLGLVPRQNSTGGKQKLLGITKTGDKYIRKLLVHGARNELQFAARREHLWLIKLAQRRGRARAAVALANKNARRIWAALRLGEEFKLAA